MFKNKFFKRKRKNKMGKENDTETSHPPSQMPVSDELSLDDCDCEDGYEDVNDDVMVDEDDYDYYGDFHYADINSTQLRRNPSNKLTQQRASIRRNYSKEALVDLPLQHVSSTKRMEDLDEEEYGYSTTDNVYKAIKKKEMNFKDVFVDAQKFVTYQENDYSPMVNQYFFSPTGVFDEFSAVEISQKMDSASKTEQHELKKYIAAQLLPNLRANNKIFEIFTLLSCKNKQIRSLCIQELTEIILEIDHTKFSHAELIKLYKFGTVQLFSIIAETKKSFSIFQPLIELGISFNCFMYLKAIEATDNWIADIGNLVTSIQSKVKRVAERSDPDIQVFMDTARSIFELENVNLDDILFLGEDMDDFSSEFSREDTSTFIEGLASLFQTGNLILRQPSKFKPGVERLVRMTTFMDGSDNDGMVKWFHRLLTQFVLRILHQEHYEVKIEVLNHCEDELFSIFTLKTFNPEAFKLTHRLLFHRKEDVRSKYRKIANTVGIGSLQEIMKLHIQTLLNRWGLDFEGSTSGSQENDIFERKQCTFCREDASITCIYETFLEEFKPLEIKDDMPVVKNQTMDRKRNSKNKIRKRDLENEMDVLKQIESKEIHRNVVRLLAFNESFPKFYIKERLPGDNLQRRLLEAREKNKIIPISNLIRIIIQAIRGVLYVHSRGCLVRDITTASFGCSVTDDGYFVKLKNFEKAAKPSEFSNDGIISGLIDLDFGGVPVRWAAPESLLEGHYSIYSDVWSVNILADEILNYAAWPYSDISDADINDMVTNIVFTHLKPQGFNRPRRIQGLILEGLATVPEQRLKLEALRERLVEILDNVDGGGSCTLYDTHSGLEGSHAETYDIPPLTERQIQANSKFKRGIPPSIQKYRELDEDPATIFALEVAENNSKLKEQSGIDTLEISDDYFYSIESEGGTSTLKVMERVTDDFLKYTYNRLKEIDGRKMCVEPWPPTKSASADGLKLHYRFPKSRHLLDIVLHKERGETIGPYIELLYELVNHVDSFHSEGWIFRCLRAKNVWILDKKEKEQTIVVPKFGKYRKIVSSENDMHFEQIKIESQEDVEGVQWLPIETIKAGLYSKESDVYAFGMVTWEVMSAFGQEGVVYHQDEERELTCIPFNYQQSENLLQHLIEGYIPEKPLKCPDWFYQEITRPCLLHQKIDRPSMKKILQILRTRLGKKIIPKRLPPPIPVKISTDEGFFDSCRERIERQKLRATNDTKSSPHISVQCNSKDYKRQDSEQCRLRRPPPVPQKPCNPKQGKVEISNFMSPPRDHTETDTVSPPVPKRLPPQGLTVDKGISRKSAVYLHTDQARMQIETDQYEGLFDFDSATTSPGLTSSITEQDAINKSSKKVIPFSQIPRVIVHKNEIKKVKDGLRRLPMPPVPPRPSTLNQNTSDYFSTSNSSTNSEDLYDDIAVPVQENSIATVLPEGKEVSSISCKSLALPNLPIQNKNDREYKHRNIPPTQKIKNPPPSFYLESDFKKTAIGRPDISIGKNEDFDNSSDFDLTEFDPSDSQIEDTYKGSDICEDDACEDTQKGSDFDLSYEYNNIAAIHRPTSSQTKTKPTVLPKPRFKPEAVCNTSKQDIEANYTLTVTNVSKNEKDLKPNLPQRKPLEK